METRPLNLNDRQYQLLMEVVLANPYDVLHLDGDVEKSATRALRQSLKLPKGNVLQGDLFEASRLQDLRRVISALKLATSNRGKGLTRELNREVQDAKFMWAKYVCAHHQVDTSYALNELCKKVWGSRLPDRYRETLKSHVASSLPSAPDPDLDSLFGVSIPNPSLEEALKKAESNKEERVEFNFGGVDFVLSKGSRLTIKSFTTEKGATFNDIVVEG